MNSLHIEQLRRDADAYKATEEAKAREGHPPVQDPAMVIAWKDTDTATGAEGWIVIDKLLNGVAGGGIFMKPGASLQEVADIARNMSRKFTVTSPQIGGAKAGINFDHRDPRAQEVLRRFIQDNAYALREFWVTAGDLNTDDGFIERVVQGLGLPTCQATLGRKFAEATGQVDLSTQLARLIGIPAACEYFPLIEGAVGFGVATAVHFALNLHGAREARVVIQGFGAVGSSLAYYLQQRSCGGVPVGVAAIADADGVLLANPGTDLDIDALLALRATKVRDAKTAGAVAAAAYLSKNLVAVLRDEPDGGARFGTLVQTPLTLAEVVEAAMDRGHVDVVCPCALRYVVTENVVERVFGAGDAGGGTYRTPTILVCGANNPYGAVDAVTGVATEDKTHAVYRALIGAKVTVVPDWVANSGTAQLFHVGLSRDFGTDPCAAKILAACVAPITNFLNTAYKAHGGSNPVLLAHACEKLAAHRLAHPLPFVMAHGAGGGTAGGLSLSKYALPPAVGLPPADVRYAQLMAFASRIGCEVIQGAVEDGRELLQLLRECVNPVVYDGFEPSGRMHIAQGLLKSVMVREFTKAGFTFVLYVADWFAKLNNKMGGDMDKIKLLGQYFVEVWKSCGMPLDRVRFVWASELMGDEYWASVMTLATKVTHKRVQRCIEIMGRKAEDALTVAQCMYPVMQVTDMCFRGGMGVDVAQLGLDQRKVNMLAREESSTLGRERPPVVYSHPMLPGLIKGQEKMSKSNPDSAIFMEDSADEVVRKIGKAHCPPGSEGEDANPCLAYFKVIVFSLVPTVTVRDSRTNAVIGDYTSYSQLAAAYAGGAIHPLDLKQCLAAAINTLLEPTRRHFATNPEAIKLHAAVVAAMTEHAAAGGAAGGAVGGAAGGAAGADAGASAAEPSV